MSKTIKNTEPRFTGDWEPTVEVKSRGPSNSTMKRKVVTKSKVFVKVDLDRVIRELRHGHEVVLVADQKMPDTTGGIRLFPCMEKDLKTMFVAAQTVGDFRHSISDIKTTVRYRGKEMASADCEQLVAIAAKRFEVAKREAACPTRVVSCPKCGYEFEIGGLKAK